MHLSKLDIIGFKSFANKTVVHFNHGITAIVGPNGCGKTNIVDALRWCLGEQKSSILRSDKMENVIFNGTSSKKPLGVAEVSLTIQNDKGILPTEYSEVIITRRIYRSGESEYLLNKNIARLKDITGLFMDTGMGANAYSVIELKMVESILSNKTEERRAMFEEAAGVNKYKVRRKLTLRKLEEVRIDLNRASDLISEIEKKVISLERQAKKSEKYKQLSERLKEIELSNASFEVFILVDETNKWEESLEHSKSLKEEIEAKLKDSESEHDTVKSEILVIEGELKEVRKNISSLTEKIYLIERNISVSKETKNSLDKNIHRYTDEIKEFEYRIEQVSESLEELREKEGSYDGLIALKQKEKDGFEAEVVKIKEQLEESRKSLKLFTAEMNEKSKNFNELGNRLKGLELQLGNNERSKTLVENAINELITKNESALNSKNEISIKKESSINLLAIANSEFEKLSNLKEKLEHEISSKKNEDLEIRSELSEVRNRINFLQELIDNLENLSQGSKSILKLEEESGKKVTLLSGETEVNEKFKFALEAALKNYLSSILLESIAEVKSKINFLNDSGNGKASFLIPVDPQKYKRTILGKLSIYVDNQKSKKISAQKGFTGWAKDYVTVSSKSVKIKKYVEKLLSNVVIVKDIETAIQLNDKIPGFTYVTENGDSLTPNGALEAGSIPKADETVFGRKIQLTELHSQLPVLEKKFELLREEIAKLENSAAEIDLKTAENNIKTAEIELVQIDKSISQLEYESKLTTAELEKNKSAYTDYNSEIDRLQRELTEVLKLTEEANNEKVNSEQSQKELELSSRTLEESFQNIQNLFNEAKISLERLTGEKRNSANLITRNTEVIDQLKSSIKRKENDILNSKNELELLDGAIADMEVDLDDLKRSRDNLKQNENGIEQNYSAKRVESLEIEKKLKQIRAERDSVSELMHAADIKIHENSLKLKNIFENIYEKYAVQIEPVQPEENYDIKTVKAEIKQIEEQLRNLGPVNLLAYEEFVEEKSRFDDFTQQKNDLINAEKDLIKTIEEINETAQRLFFETFEAIRTNFNRIFQSLFRPGDESDLKLEEGVDPLEAKIEIIAKPRGKRPTSIELLSGGEKTLTAIALLFAIYLVKPSPFCILDEIDAPLDDANIDRFTKIIREFSLNTQFIVVTHNKRTMEAADVLYGVTMQEEGISKLVSVKFNEDYAIKN